MKVKGLLTLALEKHFLFSCLFIQHSSVFGCPWKNILVQSVVITIVNSDAVPYCLNHKHSSST